jgi:cell division protein ZapA
MSQETYRDPGVTPVTIYGRTYRLRGDEDPGYLKELAAIVDAKMREVARASSTADTLKVAILAGLNLADEYLKASRGETSGDTSSEGENERLARLVTLLDEALDE